MFLLSFVFTNFLALAATPDCGPLLSTLPLPLTDAREHFLTAVVEIAYPSIESRNVETALQHSDYVVLAREDDGRGEIRSQVLFRSIKLDKPIQRLLRAGAKFWRRPISQGLTFEELGYLGTNKILLRQIVDLVYSHSKRNSLDQDLMQELYRRLVPGKKRPWSAPVTSDDLVLIYFGANRIAPKPNEFIYPLLMNLKTILNLAHNRPIMTPLSAKSKDELFQLSVNEIFHYVPPRADELTESALKLIRQTLVSYAFVKRRDYLTRPGYDALVTAYVEKAKRQLNRSEIEKMNFLADDLPNAIRRMNAPLAASSSFEIKKARRLKLKE